VIKFLARRRNVSVTVATLITVALVVMVKTTGRARPDGVVTVRRMIEHSADDLPTLHIIVSNGMNRQVAWLIPYVMGPTGIVTFLGPSRGILAPGVAATSSAVLPAASTDGFIPRVRYSIARGPVDHLRERLRRAFGLGEPSVSETSLLEAQTIPTSPDLEPGSEGGQPAEPEPP
jgi:hypothetical protein